MAEFDNLSLTDSETGESVIVSKEDWAALMKVAGNPDDTLASLPNSSGDVDLNAFFKTLLKTLTDALNADLQAQGRAAHDDAATKLANPRAPLAEAIADALAKLSALTPAQLKVAKSLGPLFISQANEERIGKAVLKDEKSSEEKAVADTAALLNSVANMAAKPGGGSTRLV